MEEVTEFSLLWTAGSDCGSIRFVTYAIVRTFLRFNENHFSQGSQIRSEVN